MSESPEPTPRLIPLMLEGPAGPIEALLQERGETPHDVIAVVLHPHPLYGGTLHNKVAHRVASTLFSMGAAVLRFNFRGVGKSAGTHDRGIGELADAHVALRWLAARHPGARQWVAGFSFGSWVASRLRHRLQLSACVQSVLHQGLRNGAEVLYRRKRQPVLA